MSDFYLGCGPFDDLIAGIDDGLFGRPIAAFEQFFSGRLADQETFREDRRERQGHGLTDIKSIEAEYSELLLHDDSRMHAVKDTAHRHVIIGKDYHIELGVGGKKNLQRITSGFGRAWSGIPMLGRQRQPRLSQRGAEPLIAGAGSIIGDHIMPGITEASITTLDEMPPGVIASLPMRHANGNIDGVAIDVHELGDAKPSMLQMPARRRCMVQTGEYHRCRLPSKERDKNALLDQRIIIRHADHWLKRRFE